jgi:hypothetical protein
LRSRISAALVALIAVGTAGAPADAYEPSVAQLDAAARATGNEIAIAERIGETIFATHWAAEVSQISANSLAGHLIVGIRIQGVKFHRQLTREEFAAEIVALAGATFATATATEEIDIWASVPIAVAKGVVVSGDLAKPTTRTVFSISVRRGESAASLRARVAAGGEGVFVDPQWARAAFKTGA